MLPAETIEPQHDIVLLPSYYRPEFLHLCLEHLMFATGGQQKDVWVVQDRHHNDKSDLLMRLADVRATVDLFRDKFAGFRYIERTPHPFVGNPLNFLEAYKEAHATTNARLVYLVEDDVMVTKDFFLWHEAMQALHKPFVSVGWHCIRDTSGVKMTADPHGYVTSFRDFSSIGLCWRREYLAPVVEHARREYYTNPGPYLTQVFPHSPIPRNQWTEQAGLITRLLHDEPGGRLVTWAGAPRVGHIGISGYHRRQGHQFTGPLASRVKALRSIYKDTKALLRLHKSQWDDINAPQDPGPWTPEHLFCHQHVPYMKGVY